MEPYRVAADAVVIAHAAYIAFVVVGFVLIVVGVTRGWEWVRSFWFRVAHVAAIAAVCVESLVGIVCPLTTLESAFRLDGGESGYGRDFVGYWMDRLIFYNAPAWVFTVCYLAFGAAVVALFVLAPPRFPHRHIADF